jgi:ribonuclease HI
MKRKHPEFTLPTHLDHLLDKVLHTSPPEASDELGKLYSFSNLDPAHAGTHGLKVYADGLATNNGQLGATAGAGIYAGPAHPFNTTARVMGTPSNNQAELYSILLTVQKTPLHHVLDIFTDSTYVIHSLVHWSIRNAKCGWVCVNGDLLKLIRKLDRGTLSSYPLPPC